MSKQQQRIKLPEERPARTHGYWAGKPLKRSTSDLFIDRPRYPNTIFTGPNGLWNQRYPSRDHIGDIGEGQASTLRSLDVGYLTRGYVVDPPQRRAAYPGEIGWTATFFHKQCQPAKPYTTPYSLI